MKRRILYKVLNPKVLGFSFVRESGVGVKAVSKLGTRDTFPLEALACCNEERRMTNDVSLFDLLGLV